MQPREITVHKFSFGKYKGENIDAIIRWDIWYIHWLYYQSWFQEKYREEYSYLKERQDYWSDIYAESRPDKEDYI